MATENRAPGTTPQAAMQASHRGAPTPVTSQAAVSPPSKRELASWWKKFRKNNEKPDEKVDVAPGIFGVPLAESIRYANVAISLTNDQGESFIYGYVPIVVAKCGVFLKEKATDVEGIFRLSGSAKRIKDLQAIFNSPERYGKGLDWTGYTVHDAANIFRRYLNQLPEPIVPLEFYDRFRDPIRSHQKQAVGNMEAQASDIGNFNAEAAVTAYQKLITELPPLNRQLLLYILDLLAVFASKSDLNRMNSANLAAIFQPGILSHPTHDMSPAEYRLSQDVLIFLIENQDNFLIGMTGTAVDEKTVKDVESGPPPSQTSVHTPKANIGRSASNASAGADSLRKHGVRRNVSTSSRTSRDTGSNGIPSPLTPAIGGPFASGSTGSGVKRSNTVPSKKSPAIASTRFQRTGEPGTPTTPNQAPNSVALSSPLYGTYDGSNADAVGASAPTPAEGASTPRQALSDSVDREQSVPLEQRTTPASTQPPPIATRDRKISNLFSRSPVVGPSDSGGRDQKPPNKLKKKQRIPGSANESAQSSQTSLQGDSGPAFHTPLLSPDSHGRLDPLAISNPTVTSTAATPVSEVAPPARQMNAASTEVPSFTGALKPPKSPEPSIHSRSSMTDASDFDALDDPAARVEKAEKRRNRWHRFSSSAKSNGETPLAPPPPIGYNQGARLSNSSIGSSNRPRKSFTGDSQTMQQLGNDTSSTGFPSVIAQPGQDSGDSLKDSGAEPEKRGLFGKLKARMEKSREDKKDRDAEKDRAKSPPRPEDQNGGSRHSLSVFAQERLAHRGRSMDKPREDVLASMKTEPRAEQGVAPSTAPPTQEPVSSTLPEVMQVMKETPEVGANTNSQSAAEESGKTAGT